MELPDGTVHDHVCNAENSDSDETLVLTLIVGFCSLVNEQAIELS